MKALQCEKCGSIELTKSGGIYTCQACGTSYDANADNLKKVSVDHSEDIQRLYKAARRAYELGNYDAAQGYYDEILGKNPDSWEAVFYTVYLRFMQCKVGEIDANAHRMAKVLPTIIELVHDEYEPDEQDAALAEIEEDLEELNILFESSAEYLQKVKNNSANLIMATGSISGLLSGAASKLDASSEFVVSRALSAMMLCAFGDSVEKQFSEEIKIDDRKAVEEAMLRSWKAAAAVYGSINSYTLQSQVADSIRRWESEFKTSKEKLDETAEREEKERQEAAAKRKQARDEALDRNKKKIIIGVAAVVVVAAVALAIYFLIVVPENDRAKAYEAAVSTSDYAAAAQQFEALGSYRDSAEQAATLSKLAEAERLCYSGNVTAALDVLAEFPDDDERAAEIRQECASRMPYSVSSVEFRALANEDRMAYLETLGEVTATPGEGYVDYVLRSDELLSKLPDSVRSHLISSDIVIRVYDIAQNQNLRDRFAGFGNIMYREYVQYQFDAGWLGDNLEEAAEAISAAAGNGFEPFDHTVGTCRDGERDGWPYTARSIKSIVAADKSSGVAQLIVEVE